MAKLGNKKYPYHRANTPGPLSLSRNICSFSRVDPNGKQIGSTIPRATRSELEDFASRHPWDTGAGPKALNDACRRNGVRPVSTYIKTPVVIALSLESPFAPQVDDEEVVERSVKYMNMTLRFYKEPRATKDHPGLSRFPGDKADLEISFVSELDGQDVRRGRHSLTYSTWQDELWVSAKELTVKATNWRKRGALMSQLDLLGSKVVMRLEPLIWKKERQIRCGRRFGRTSN